MTDKTQEAINLGQKAETLLNNEFLKAVFASIKTDIIAGWTKEKDEDRRVDMWFEYQAVTRIETKLQTLMANGRMAKHSIET